MKIVFNLYNVGLGNNGGSKTLIRCSEALADLGHDVVLFTNYDIKYNWHKINSKVKIEISKKHPKCDVSIATGLNSVQNVVESTVKRKFYYIRGYELWQAKAKVLDASYRKLNCIVNSEWLYRYLEERKISSQIIYPGLDFNLYANSNKERENILGGLWHKKHKTKNFNHVENVANQTGYPLRLLGKSLKNPSVNELVKFYNSIKVWVAPTELEGLHNPPMESSLCGAVLVCTNHERSGMSDYAVPGETAMVYEAGDINQASLYVDKLMKEDDLRKTLIKNMGVLLKNKIGDRISNMRKLVNYVEKF